MRGEDKTIEAMKQALDALEGSIAITMAKIARRNKAITALRAAITEAAMQQLTDVQQEIEAPRVNQCAEVCERAKLCAICARGLERIKHEPVAWMSQGGDVSRSKKHFNDMGFVDLIPLYTHPHRREWRGLTDEEMRQAAQAMDAEPLAEGWKELIKFARAIEAKLKEKNGG